MPYKLRKAPNRELYWVVTKATGHKHSKEPIPLETAHAQIRALHMHGNGLKQSRVVHPEPEPMPTQPKYKREFVHPTIKFTPPPPNKYAAIRNRIMRAGGACEAPYHDYTKGKASVFVLTCIDPRYTFDVAYYLQHKKELHQDYDLFTLAGASLGVEQKDWTKTFFDNLELGMKLHKVSEVWCFDHLDCGMYKATFGLTKDDDPAIHKTCMDKLKTMIHKKHPHLKFREFIVNAHGHIQESEVRGGVLTDEDRRKHAEHIARLKEIRDAAMRQARFNEPAAPEPEQYGPPRPTTGMLARRFAAYGYGKCGGMDPNPERTKMIIDSLKGRVPPPPEHPIITKMKEEYRTTRPEYKAERDAREKQTEDAQLYDSIVRQVWDAKQKRSGKGPPKHTKFAISAMRRNMLSTDRQIVDWLKLALQQNPNINPDRLIEQMDRLLVPRSKQNELLNQVIAEVQRI